MQISILHHILFEDPYILLINKPAGLMVEPDRNNHPNLLHQVRAYLKSKLPKGEEVYAQHIHRLDRPVNGIVLFAKQKSVLKNLSEQFAERRVKKFYRAITEKAPENLKGRLEHWHRKEKKKAVLRTEEFEYSEKAILEYEIQKRDDGRFLWAIELHTGKYHQIRAQLAETGCPIIGDILYGSLISYPSNTIALTAFKLEFAHPVSGEKVTIQL